MSKPDAINRGARGIDENLPLEVQTRVYPAIDPWIHFEEKTFKGKVVLVTGASRGIGADIAEHFAKAGAIVAIVSRTQEKLEETKKAILATEPNAQVLTCVADVADYAAAEAVVNEVVERFGRLDVLVPNAGTLTPIDQPIEAKDPKGWWRTFEINVLAQVRMPGGSDYGISKHAVNRFIEFVDLENPDIKSFSLHPGRIWTSLADDAGIDPEFRIKGNFHGSDLPAATALYLAAGNADWLSGRFVNSNWDLSIVERDWKEKILEKGALINKLSLP